MFAMFAKVAKFKDDMFLETHQLPHLAKLKYFTNLDFPEIRKLYGISLPKSYLLGAQNSCEVAIIWPEPMYPNNKWPMPNLGSFTSPCINDTWREVPQGGEGAVEKLRSRQVAPIRILKMFYNQCKKLKGGKLIQKKSTLRWSFCGIYYQIPKSWRRCWSGS